MPKQKSVKMQKLRNNEYYDTQDIFDELYQRSSKSEVFNNLMKIIRSDNNIKLAYRNIKNNSGSNTAGVDEKTIKQIEEMSEVEYVKFVKEKLNWYKPKAVRRVEIEKYPGSGTYRPLGIPTIADRLVQQCILQVLEPICEAKFHDKSYGFRPNRSCEHALAQANSYMYAGKMYFVVDIDIKGFFDSVDHSKLIKQMWTMGVRDKQLISIIKEMLKAPIKMPGGEIISPTKGTPQGGILSPLLSNIVLNELDWWIQSQWADIPTRHSYSCKDSKVNMLKKHTNLKEMYIVRYADDFKIFCRTHTVAVKTFHAVKQWLKERLRLEISEEKSKITNLKKHYTEFLGFKMKVRKKGKIYVTSSRMTEKAVEKVTNNLISQICEIQKAADKKDRYAKVSKYNSMVIGVHNYYSMAVQVSQDFKKIARQITCVMKNRFRKDLKSMKQIRKANIRKRKKDKKPRSFDIVINKAVSERYNDSDQMRYLNEFAVAPVGYVRMRIPMKKAHIINKYTVEGRTEIHKNLKMDLSVIKRLMENPVLNRTIQYADNRISRFIAQYGKCSVTNVLLRYEEVHCHHKKLRSNGKDDSYGNLAIVHKDIHKLIHATDDETISKYVRKHGETINFSKLNKLRKAVKNSEIKNNVLDNPNAKYVMMESRVRGNSRARFGAGEKGLPNLVGNDPYLSLYNTEAQKKELFANVRSGKVRILFGSTAKCGAGTNIQDKLVALHDLDCPWRPADLAQRLGRIVRQGNSNPEVYIFRYVTEATFDAYLFQTVQKKQEAISPIMTNKSPIRACDDLDEQALSYAEIKALCAGNPLIAEKMNLDVEVAKLRMLKASHQSQQYRMEDNLRLHFPKQIESTKANIEGYAADIERLEVNTHKVGDGISPMKIDDSIFTERKDAGTALIDVCKTITTTERHKIGSYRGFELSVSFDPHSKEHKCHLKGALTHMAMLGSDPVGNITRIDNVLARIPPLHADSTSELETLYSQVENAKAELTKPFPQETELAQKSARLTELDSLLSLEGKEEPAADAREGVDENTPEKVLAVKESNAELSGDENTPKVLQAPQQQYPQPQAQTAPIPKEGFAAVMAKAEAKKDEINADKPEQDKTKNKKHER